MAWVKPDLNRDETLIWSPTKTTIMSRKAKNSELWHYGLFYVLSSFDATESPLNLPGSLPLPTKSHTTSSPTIIQSTIFGFWRSVKCVWKSSRSSRDIDSSEIGPVLYIRGVVQKGGCSRVQVRFRWKSLQENCTIEWGLYITEDCWEGADAATFWVKFG